MSGSSTNPPPPSPPPPSLPEPGLPTLPPPSVSHHGPSTPPPPSLAEPGVPTLPPAAPAPVWAPDPNAATPPRPPSAFHPMPPGVAPPRKRRRRAWPGVLIFFVLFFGAIAVVNGWADYRSERDRRSWPEVTVTFDHRSARLDYETEEIGIPRSNAKIDVDLETGHIRVESQDYSWRGDRAHWYAYDGVDWIRYTNVEADLELLADMDRYASGMTIDQVLPPPARTHVRIVEVREENVGGVAARHFTLLLDEWRLADDVEASRAMNAWWGLETVEASERYSNLELWVADDGEVLRIRSASDIDDLYFSVRVVTTSDRPFDADLPTEFLDGD